MSLGRIRAVVRKELRDYRRNRFTITTTAVMPLVFLISPTITLLRISGSANATVVDRSVGVKRRAVAAHDPQLRIADLVLNPASREVFRGEEHVSLTRTEYSLLERLMYRSGKVVSRRSLIEAVWGFEREIEGNTLDAFMHLLRNKVDLPGRPKLIHTVRGVGYMIRSDEQA